MIVAIPSWLGRVAPVFDVAQTLLVASVADGTVTERRQIGLRSATLHSRTTELLGLSVGVLICGAISWPLQRALAQASIVVRDNTCGELEAVLTAFAEHRLTRESFLMPGCCRHRRRGWGNAL